MRKGGGGPACRGARSACSPRPPGDTNQGQRRERRTEDMGSIPDAALLVASWHWKAASFITADAGRGGQRQGTRPSAGDCRVFLLCATGFCSQRAATSPVSSSGWAQLTGDSRLRTRSKGPAVELARWAVITPPPITLPKGKERNAIAGPFVHGPS